MPNAKVVPAWQKNFGDLIKTERILNLQGFVHDKYLSYDQSGYSRLKEYLNDVLKAEGFTDIQFFEPVRGFTDEPSEREDASGGELRGKSRSITVLSKKIFRETANTDHKKAFVVEDASFLNVANGHLSNEEHDAWVRIRSAFASCSDEHRLILVFENGADIPKALDATSGLTKELIISRPDQTQRKQFISFVYPHLSDTDVDHLADISGDIGLQKLEDIFKNVFRNDASPDKTTLAKAIRRYVYGFADNPWRRLEKSKILALKDMLKKSIKGQDSAIDAVVDEILSAYSGMRNVLYGANAPKGIAVLCGPTGVGKTEMAKQLAKNIMGDPNLLIRIDCNEYGQPHQAQRLIGSPPGYVGFEQGGQLTNAINARPFSFVLFDEIEKADANFWDYLMQVLQDGRLTDGRGNLSVFNNAFLIFTTNLGAREAAECDDPEEARMIIVSAIEDYFREINRKEIFGRLKHSIIPFNSITDEAAREIVESHMKSICENYYAEEKVTLRFSDQAITTLQHIAGHASEYGGRDVKDIVNGCLKNRLSNLTVTHEIGEGTVIAVKEILETDDDNHPIDLVYDIDNSNYTQPQTEIPATEEPHNEAPASVPGRRRMPVSGDSPVNGAAPVNVVTRRR
jgi:ATP-dependent Clp protease ATP-binding subunit ClpA